MTPQSRAVPQYRAILVDPGMKHDRPIQTITLSMQDLKNWVIETLGGGTQLQGESRIEFSDEAKVEVYVMEERLVDTFDINTARELRKKKLEAQR